MTLTEEAQSYAMDRATTPAQLTALSRAFMSGALQALAALKPAFKEDGRITAGNSSQMSDGAAATVVMSAQKAKELGLTPLARIVATAATGLSPEIMGLGPIQAVRKVLRTAGMSISDIDLFEINEAFAAVSLASTRELGVDPAKVNPNGGAVALGPFVALRPFRQRRLVLLQHQADVAALLRRDVAVVVADEFGRHVAIALRPCVGIADAAGRHGAPVLLQRHFRRQLEVEQLLLGLVVVGFVAHLDGEIEPLADLAQA